jgi:MFS transporter, FHS family, L-fucose permease
LTKYHPWLIAITAQDMVTICAVIGICFFMSIMFPTIFAFGIKNLGANTEYGSSLTIMAIVGDAILAALFWYISDATGNIQLGYFSVVLLSHHCLLWIQRL